MSYREPSIKHTQWKEYSGPVTKGNLKVKLEGDHSHWERAVWLTCQVENGGRADSGMGYDGCGHADGLLHWIAVFPKELAHEDNNPEDDQGPLWEVIEEIREHNASLTSELERHLYEAGWVLEDGTLREEWNGATALGMDIRNELTPPNGKVPASGPAWEKAKEYALIFHRIFGREASLEPQMKYAERYFKSICRRKPQALRGKSVEELVYNDNCDDTKLFSINDPMDLAMCAFYAYSVNAPALAFRRLHKALETFGRRPNWQNPTDRRMFAKRLILSLGTANLTRWNFKAPSGRYQRTRNAASTVWPREMFEMWSVGTMFYRSQDREKIVMPRRL